MLQTGEKQEKNRGKLRDLLISLTKKWRTSAEHLMWSSQPVLRLNKRLVIGSSQS